MKKIIGQTKHARFQFGFWKTFQHSVRESMGFFVFGIWLGEFDGEL